ncbi:IS3 family transposase [Leuconostoc lactis]|uniref:IS3 family transposase n=1 Tax=Leuconostoc lactis TaxID=1246 RepID=UPI0034E23F35
MFHHYDWATRQVLYSSTKALIDAVNNWILYDNNTRIQTKLNGHSPVEYRQLAA